MAHCHTSPPGAGQLLPANTRPHETLKIGIRAQEVPRSETLKKGIQVREVPNSETLKNGIQETSAISGVYR